MTVKLTNISGGQIVCDLKKGTLRLNNKQSDTFEENVLTSHVNNLISKGLIRKEAVREKAPVEKSAVKKEKEEKENGNV